MKSLKTAMKRTLAGLALSALVCTGAFAVGGKSTAFETALLNLLFKGTTVTSIADNTATTPATVLCLTLHTADPGASGTSTTNGAAYTSYAPVSVARDGTHWTVTSNSVSPASNIDFPSATGGSETETYFGVSIPTSGSTCTGSLTLMFRGPISPNLVISSGVTPRLTTSTAITEN